MNRPGRTPPPLWFAAVLTAAWYGVCHTLELHALEAPHVQTAFFGFLIWLGEIIWNGLEAAGHVTLAIVAASVQQLWSFARSVFNTAVDLGRVAAAGFKDAWGFVQKLYDDILKPAWLKFWALVDRVRGALERALKPVIQFLQSVRRELLTLYNNWIRPVLDTIDAFRKVLRVLETLHLDFARKLDAELGRLENLIDTPFRYVLGKLNEIINLVNRVVDGNGLFQRLALIRSIERDVVFVHREFLNAWHHPLGDDERANAQAAAQGKTVDDAARDVRQYLETGGGAVAPVVDEQIEQWRIYLRAS